jgi:acetoin:2,6-dichlorophenolindophenol oxidoreductase subunit alpha
MTTGTRRDAAIPVETLERMHRSMLRIREVELTLKRLFAEGKLPGFIHCYVGEEAVAVGICEALRRSDLITSTHRGHGHILAKGGDLRRFMAEAYGRDAGYCHGKGGSMHIADLEIGILGANAIVGGGIPIAVGAACSAQILGDERVAVSFFGDGASGIGSFHEALNLAGVWRLPVIFVCENNGYAEFTAFGRHASAERVADRAAGYGMPGITVDGNDVEAVHRAACEAVGRARAGDGPTLIEATTYRLLGHYEGDPETYRSSTDVDQWRDRDPLARSEQRLRERGALTEGQLAGLRAEIAEEIADAIAFAESSEPPAVESSLSGAYRSIVEQGW